jgi:hypothetical protein
MLTQMLPSSLCDNGTIARRVHHANQVEAKNYAEQAAVRRESRELLETAARIEQADAIIIGVRNTVRANEKLVCDLAGGINLGSLNEELMYFEETMKEVAKLHKGCVNFRPFLDVLDILLTWEPNADTFAVMLDFIHTRILPVVVAKGDWAKLFFLVNAVPGQGSAAALQPLYAKLKIDLHRVMLDEPNDEGLVTQFTQLREIAEEVGKTYLARNNVDLGAAAKQVTDAQAGTAQQ